MFNSLWCSILSGVVLIGGLMSCGPDKHVKDVYEAAPPKVAGAELKTWESLKTRSLELQDQFDFTASAPSSVRIRAACRRGADHFTANLSFGGPTKIPIWRTLHDSLLTSRVRDVECAFELNLFNSEGSNHVFSLSPVEIREDLPAPVSLGREPAGGGDLRFDLSQLQAVRARYRNDSPAAAQAVCGEISVKPLPFEQVLDLSSFDFLHPLDGEWTDENVAPIQSCRLFVSEGGARRGMSALFQIVLPLPKLSIETLPVPLRGPQTVSSVAETLGYIAGGGKLVLAAWKITNGTRRTRVLRLPDGPTALNLRAFMLLGEGNFEVPAGTTAIMSYGSPWVTIERDPAEGIAGRTLVLEADESATLYASLTPPGPLHCRSARSVLKGLTLSGFDPIRLLDVTSVNEPVGEFVFNVAEPIEFLPYTLPPAIKTPTVDPTLRCAWP